MSNGDELIPYFVVFNKDTKETFENGFSLEAMEYYASKRENCEVGLVMVSESELEIKGD